MFPSIYKALVEFGEKEDRVFVVMPFRETFEKIVLPEIIEPACKSFDLTAFPVYLENKPDSISDEINNNILRSKLILIDLSVNEKTGQRNPNVFYELGLAHAWRLPEELVIIKHDDDELPFDLVGYRCKKYDLSDIKSSQLTVKDEIDNRLTSIESNKKRAVMDAARRIDHHCIIWAKKTLGHHFNSADCDRADKVQERFAIHKLLELSLVELDTAKQAEDYAYHWTSFGLEVMESLGIEMKNHSSRKTGGGSNTQSKSEGLINSSGSIGPNPVTAASSGHESSKVNHPVIGTAQSFIAEESDDS